MFFNHEIEWMKYLIHMESSLSGPNYEEYFQGLVEVLKNQEFDFILCID